MQVSVGTWEGRYFNLFIPIHKVSRLNRDPGAQSNSLEEVDGHQENGIFSPGNRPVWHTGSYQKLVFIFVMI